MATLYYTVGPGARLVEALGADDSLRNQIPGDLHLVSLDGKTFYPFFRRPEPGDYERVEGIAALEGSERSLDFARGIVERAIGNIEEIDI